MSKLLLNVRVREKKEELSLMNSQFRVCPPMLRFVEIGEFEGLLKTFKNVEELKMFATCKRYLESLEF
ncbi:hypothetical protein Hypma_012731 [Hypsizygus marmoreus]|uniref:Uncharacterized protein n=1 Tax=Hypsizygus marmoreus TaxID=39966 RepID=A0A369JKN6_HYPMA|nr:hypothetical protein Hypma_012731 [Hypsizygus marmoreus]